MTDFRSTARRERACGAKPHGFTLVELMIVVAVVALLSAVALPAYQDYIVRSRVVEGLVSASEARLAVSAGASTGDLAAAAGAVNSAFTPTKYVSRRRMDPATGVITVTFNAGNIGRIPIDATLTMSPYLNNAIPISLQAAIAANAAGVVDWLCQSTTARTADARGLGAIAVNPGTLPAQFAPNECR